MAAGFSDGTLAVAAKHGVEHMVKLPHNQGLARAFMAGIEGSLDAGADIIVNTDEIFEPKVNYSIMQQLPQGVMTHRKLAPQLAHSQTADCA